LSLESTDPLSVAIAFFQAMFEYDSSLEAKTIEDPQLADTDETKEPEVPNLEEDSTAEEGLQDSLTIQEPTGSKDPVRFLSQFIHVIQFCHLCYKGKISPVFYTLTTSPEIKSWYGSLMNTYDLIPRNTHKRLQSTPDSLASDNKITSPDSKISRKDKHFLNAMLKIHDTLDKNMLRNSKDREEKEPGFARLEQHKKNMILNASAIPPFDEQAETPTEFYASFLSKKSQLKAKDMLTHRFLIDKISFNPSAAFTNCIWSGDFFWILPDAPSGVSIFYCPESKSLNAHELEKERALALADKIKQGDIEKMSKQKLYLPTSVMDMIWMTQNLQATLSLCFGPKSHSATFLDEWAQHMYQNRIMYTSLQTTDSSFFAKVLFAIDSSLQIHWRSCSQALNRASVNDKVLLMQDCQDQILRHNFIQQLPKILIDKIDYQNNSKSNNGGKRFQIPDRDKDNHGKDIITNPDKSHLRWRIREGENFAQIFHANQKKCPKTTDGKTICMKFFLRGLCDRSCPRTHKLSSDDEKAFDTFVSRCREGGAGKPDF
jgi:hypothetical protein